MTIRRDARRTRWLEEQGYRVIRFADADVMHNMEGVLLTIIGALAAPHFPNPLPHAGEGN